MVRNKKIFFNIYLETKVRIIRDNVVVNGEKIKLIVAKTSLKYSLAIEQKDIISITEIKDLTSFSVAIKSRHSSGKRSYIRFFTLFTIQTHLLMIIPDTI